MLDVPKISPYKRAKVFECYLITVSSIAHK